jgi:hypothetical protein
MIYFSSKTLGLPVGGFCVHSILVIASQGAAISYDSGRGDCCARFDCGEKHASAQREGLTTTFEIR